MITIGELYYGAIRTNNVEANLARIRRVTDVFAVIDLNRSMIKTYASIKRHMEKMGKPVEDFDLLIAATSLVIGYRLVTNNEKHFRHIPGLIVENWLKL